MSLISVSRLQKLIHTTVQNRILEEELIPITQSVGRVLAQNIVSTINIPSANISAMDGYALPQHSNVGEQLEIIGESIAGKPFSGSVPVGCCVRIMTGAIVPSDCITVVIQENVKRDNQIITINQATHERTNIRGMGEVVRQGDTVLHTGRVIQDSDVMLMASIGLAQIKVIRKVQVAILSTGSELQEVGTVLDGTHKIYDCNRPMLMAKLSHLPIEIIDLGRIQDNLDEIMATLKNTANQVDIIITSGGASVGDYDFIYEIVEQIGTIHHYKVAMKPGKPFIFGQLGTSWYFGLPGNPISGFVGFDLFVKSVIYKLSGVNNTPKPLQFWATLKNDLKKSTGRAEYQRIYIEQDSTGQWFAHSINAQDSHNTLTASHANALAILPEETAFLPAGSSILVQPYRESFL